MNSHQRRKASRARHMLLPLTKEIRPGALLGRRVYLYGNFHVMHRLTRDNLAEVSRATVARHIFGRNRSSSGEATAIDIELHSHDGRTLTLKTNANRLRLKDVRDRAPRPWWVDLKRRHREEARR